MHAFPSLASLPKEGSGKGKMFYKILEALSSRKQRLFLITTAADRSLNSCQSALTAVDFVLASVHGANTNKGTPLSVQSSNVSLC